MLEKIYSILPLYLQNLAISAYGIHWHYRRFGGVFESELAKCKEREYYTSDQWKVYQQTKLSELLVHAYRTVPFYRDSFSNAGFSLIDLSMLRLDQVHLLPMLTKDQLRKYGKTTLMSSKAEKGTFLSSSGSTGTPTSIYFSRKMHQRWSALFEARIRHWSGVDRDDKRGMIGGRRILPDAQLKSPFHRYNYIEKQVYFSAYHITPKSSKDYIEAMYKYQLEYMTGYAMANYFLAQMIEDRNLKAPKLKAVITSSEKLTEEMRATFRRVYGCETYDSYSGCEACGLISESPEGNLLFSPDSGILEVIKPDKNYAKPGEMGEVVSTGFLNFNQPLIRYKIGDMVTLDTNQSPVAGRHMVRIEEIIGRVEDVVVGKDGRKMVRFHSLFYDLEGLKTAQLIQRNYELIEFNLVCVHNINKANMENEINKRLFSQMGEINTRFNYLNELPIEANGKVKTVISHVK